MAVLAEKINFKEKLAKKNNSLTPKMALNEVLDNVDDIDRLVVSFIDKDGYVNSVCSDQDTIEAIGLLRVSEDTILNY